MPETNIDDHNDPQQPNETREDYLVRVERSRIRDLETRAQARDEAEQRAAAAERKLAFAEAGLDLSSDDEKVQFFIDGYKGDLDAAAIKAKAEAFGVLGGTTPPPAADDNPDTPLDPGEANFTDERRTVATAAPPDNAPTVDPYKAAHEVFDKVVQDGGQEKHALGAALNSLANAAHANDERVILARRAGLA